MSVAATILLLFVLVGSALTVYAIYRYGVIPTVRALRNDPVLADLWRHGGWRYRVSLIAIAVALSLAVAAGALLMAGLVWQAGVAFLVSVTIIAIANYERFQIVRRFRGK